MKYLSRVLAAITPTVEFNFHPLCRPLQLTHLCFADDLLMFCRGDRQSILVMLRSFATFSAGSGLVMNSDKSDIYFNGMDVGEIAYILNVSGFKEGAFPFKYLGIPISYKRMAIGDCTKLVEKVVERIRGWVVRKISYAGSEGYHRTPYVAWAKICQDKKVGGLGIVNCRLWNIAMLGKYTWWLASKADHLWVRWVNHIYIKGQDWFHYIPSMNTS
ncbi:uncharacterized protein LOC141607006 [Silene latifolia]|uniref:uncharacterized protein LOC141607006 n=1 Tax=Silene latifolia TaxID=37657 RepID=UPI003D783D3E